MPTWCKQYYFLIYFNIDMAGRVVCRALPTKTQISRPTARLHAMSGSRGSHPNRNNSTQGSRMGMDSPRPGETGLPSLQRTDSPLLEQIGTPSLDLLLMGMPLSSTSDVEFLCEAHL
jgi:hypothetical protein